MTPAFACTTNIRANRFTSVSLTNSLGNHPTADLITPIGDETKDIAPFDCYARLMDRRRNTGARRLNLGMQAPSYEGYRLCLFDEAFRLDVRKRGECSLWHFSCDSPSRCSRANTGWLDRATRRIDVCQWLIVGIRVGRPAWVFGSGNRRIHLQEAPRRRFVLPRP